MRFPGLIRSRPNPPRRRSRRRELGQGLTELALVTPILLLLFAAAADMGRAVYAFVAVENAAKEGALFGAQRPMCDLPRGTAPAVTCANPHNVTWRAQNETDLTPTGTPSPLNTSISCIDRTTAAVYTGAGLVTCDEGDTYVVAVSYNFRLLTPILGDMFGGALTLASESRAIVLNTVATSTLPDPTPGVSVQKLILASTARNGSDVVLKCLEPDDSDANGFYRSSCRDSTNNNNPLLLQFDTGDPITFKITIGNSGSVALSGLTITDVVDGVSFWPPATVSCPARPTSLAVAAIYTCEYTVPAPTPLGGAVEADSTNQVTASATGVAPEVDQTTVRVELPPPDLLVLKYVSPYSAGDDGDGQPTFGTAASMSTFFNAQVPTNLVWYKVAVRNTGGQPATALSIVDSAGALPFGTALCPTPPANLAAGVTYICRYSKSYTTAGVQTNVAGATATNVPPDFNDTATATVTVAQCTGTDRVIPNLVEPPKNKAAAQAAWTAAGFTTTLTSWPGQPNPIVVTQNRQAYNCLPANATMTITKDPTP